MLRSTGHYLVRAALPPVSMMSRLPSATDKLIDAQHNERTGVHGHGGLSSSDPLIDGDGSLRKEAFMPSEQFVHYTDADTCREADFLIQFHVHV